MQENGKMSFYAKLIVVLFVIVCIIMIVRLRMEYNDLESRAAEAENMLMQYEDRIEQLEERLAHPYDEEYIARIAREQMNYYGQDDVIVYND